MNNLTLFLLGLILINIPDCLSKKSNPGGEQCFSQALNPSYSCCKGNKVIYVDNDGEWGVENGEWCGIGSGFDKNNFCSANTHGYPCCKSCTVVYTDKDGKWGVENNKWCYIKDSCEDEIKENSVKNNTVISNNNLDFSFLKLENKKKNMIYSPLSIKYALNMLQEGANGKTYTEINTVVGNEELSKYSSIDKNLSLANGLFIRDTYYDYVSPEYINTLEEKYNAEIIEDEFKSAQNANKWIEDKTLGIIKDMLSDNLVQNPSNVMLIINALAIDMEWVYQFSTQNTYGKPFYMVDGHEMKATTMFRKSRMNDVSYYKDDDLTVLTIDLKKYNEMQFEFMAIMPNENLSAYVDNVTKEQIEQIDKNLKLASDEPYGVEITIPKFKFNYDLDLKEDLKKLGINDAFEKYTADFSKMTNSKIPNEGLYVGEALHKADIDFSEEGIKAAAVTVFAMFANGLPIASYPVEIIIDKPFMFVIRDKNTKDIWFTGTVYEPNSWENDKEDYEPVYSW